MNIEKTMEQLIIKSPSVELNKTFIHNIEGCCFGNLPQNIINEICKDGRPFSKFIERWLEQNYPLKYVPGDKDHDHVDINDSKILYDAKTFTKGGCKICSSKMIGVGRKFNKEEFAEKTKKLIFCIVSNINFPEIKLRFVRGSELLEEYPKGLIPSKDYIKFFN
jgi:hypothetical protein